MLARVRTRIHRPLLLLLAGAVGVVVALPSAAVPAQAIPRAISTATIGDIQAAKVGWNVVGLDSNKVTSGPNQFPNGVRLCNTGVSAAAGTATWNWTDNTHAANIFLTGAAEHDWSLPAGQCQSIYWIVTVLRSSTSYFKARGYDISVGVTGGASGTLAAGQQIYVEKLVSQNRNVVGAITGPGVGDDTTQVVVGGEYVYTVRGSTAPGGYEQLNFAAVFDPDMFDILSVEQNYTSNTAPASRVPTPNWQVYADGCDWNNSTRACISTGKVGGSMVSTYRVRIKSAGSSQLNTLIYDFSGSSYHYNADFGSGPSITAVSTQSPLVVTKQSSENTYINSTASVTFTIKAYNVSTAPAGIDDTITVTSLDDTILRPSETNSVLPVTLSSCAWPNSDDSTVRPGQVLTCTVTYSLSPDDLAVPYITNRASLIGTLYRNGAPPTAVSGSDSATLANVTRTPSISVTKSQSTSAYSAAGQAISYSMIVANNGDDTLTEVHLTDTLAPADGPVQSLTTSCAPIALPGTLAPDESTVCTTSYTTSESDAVMGGTVTNHVAATGNPLDGGPAVTAEDFVTAAWVDPGPGPQPRRPRLTVTKTASAASFTRAGESITYTVMVRNTGDVTLIGVTVMDPQVDLTCSSALPAALGPGELLTCTGDYVVTAADVSRGVVENTAVATGTDPEGRPTSDTGEVVVPLKPIPGLSVDKYVSPVSFHRAGDRLTYTVVATNTGTATLTDVTVADPLVALTCDAGNPVRTLLPGESVTCTAEYLVTHDDVAAGSILNTASARGTDEEGSTVSDDNSIVTPGPEAQPAIAVVKTASPAVFSESGDVIAYTIVATNVGNVRLHRVAVSDPLLALTCRPAAPATLSPGASLTCTGNYRVTQHDVDTGVITNTATAQARDPRNREVSDSGSDQAVALAAEPRLTLTKRASVTTATAAGQVVDYTFAVRNAGGVTVRQIAVQDEQLASGPTCPKTSLAPQDEMTCSGTYIVTRTDLERGSISNAAAVTGVPARGDLPTARASTDIDAEAAWIKANKHTKVRGEVTVITLNRIRTSNNLTTPSTLVSCTAIGRQARGNVDSCDWRSTSTSVRVRTAGRPVEVVITISASLKDDPQTQVTQRDVTRTDR